MLSGSIFSCFFLESYKFSGISNSKSFYGMILKMPVFSDNSEMTKLLPMRRRITGI